MAQAVKQPNTGHGFLDALLMMQDGGLVPDLNHDLMALIGNVRSHGKKGSLTVVLEVKPKGNGSQVIVTADVKLKNPRADRENTVLYADDNNRLSRRDPRQPSLPMADVTAFPSPVPSNVDPQTGEINE